MRSKVIIIIKLNEVKTVNNDERLQKKSQFRESRGKKREQRLYRANTSESCLESSLRRRTERERR